VCDGAEMATSCVIFVSCISREEKIEEDRRRNHRAKI